jgi:hypothetical protein
VHNVLVFSYISKPVPDEAFMKNPKYVSRFGQYKILSQNTAVIDVQSALVVERQLHINNSWL